MNRNLALFLAMCLVWGLTWLPLKLAAQHVPPIFLAAARFTLAGLVMLALAGRETLAVPRASLPLVLVTALFLNTVNYAFLFWGVAQAPTGLSAIVNFASIPLFSLGFGAMFGEERLSAAKLGAVALGLVGLVVLFSGRSLTGGPGEIAGLAAIAFGTASYCLGAVMARPLARAIPTMTLAGWQTLVGGAGLVFVSLVVEGFTPRDVAALALWPVWPSLAFLVVGGSLVGFTIYVRLLGAWGPFRAGLYAFVSPAIAVAAGVVALGETMGTVEIAGSVLMFAAAALALSRGKGG